MFFDNWDGLLRVVVVGTAAYIALIAVLRTSGKRTLAKMNAFDLVVTVGLGSTLATVLLTKDIALAEGVTAFALLVILQYAIAALSVNFKTIEKLAKSSPRILLVDGKIDKQALHEERVTEAEILAAIRGSGHGDIADIAAVLLETDGSFSVISQAQSGDRSALPTLDER